MPQTRLNGLGLTIELNLGLEKSGKCQGISYCLESGNPEHGDWKCPLCLVVGLVSSGVPDWVAMLGCNVFLIWVVESQTKSRMS